jgi:urea transport system substrate-binding protein
LPASAVLKSEWKELGCGMFNVDTNTCVQLTSNY